mmetsp:Transcript_4358/g.14303  ORF Transcript_4358/g.14303 Transcript_4358/m.14303 type:complete len:133 (+) Transcript_4358:585-983(+)|eukprot:scaffold2031_cov112-Isochrysis_galbana.AAC.3
MGLEGVRSIAADRDHSLALTQSGAVFSSGASFQFAGKAGLRPILVEGFGGVHVRRVCVGRHEAFAIGQGGELFSWGGGGRSEFWILGHGDKKHLQASGGAAGRSGEQCVGWEVACARADGGRAGIRVGVRTW